MRFQIDSFRPLILNVGCATHEPGTWNWKNVHSPFMRLYFVVEGHARVHLPDAILDLQPNHLYFIPSFTSHTYECTERFVHYYVHIYEEEGIEDSILDHWDLPYEMPAADMERMLFQRLCDANPEFRLPGSDPRLYDNRQQLERNVVINKSRSFGRKIESRGIIFLLLACLLREAVPKTSNQDPRVIDTAEYIRHHISEVVTIESLAQRACMTKDNLIRIFKREMGITPMRYINKKKIEMAQLLLVTTDLPVKQIAYRIAFDDHSYFNRLFKKLVGITPLEYRRGQYATGDTATERP